MAVHQIKSERSLYENEVRHQWAARLSRIFSVVECTALLREFRRNHIGPERSSYRLYHDALWIENAIEQRLAQLKVVELTDQDLLDKCSTGELASDVCARWEARVEAATDHAELEALATEYRIQYKPPVMPVNAWLRAERTLVTRLMLARGDSRPQDRTLEELRAERGAKLVGGRDIRTHRVEARFQDGETLAFDCGEHEDVISAALREQIILLSQCRKGHCTTCKAHCRGERQFGDGVNVYSLPEEEQDEGLVLLCQTYPRSDLVVEMPYGREMVSLGGQTVHGELSARIHSFEKVSVGVHRLVLEHLNSRTKRPSELTFTPGQFINILIPGTDEWRSFSMASPPREDGLLEFFVKEIPGGLFSERFWASAHVGFELSVQGPYGMFHINRRSQAPRCFLAGGAGIAPILAMLRSMALAGDATPSWLLLAVSEEDARLCEAELDHLRGALPSLVVDRIVSTSGARAAGKVLDRFGAMLAVAREQSPGGPDVYLCGPEGLVAAAEAVCKERGIGPRQVFFEKFLPTGPGSQMPKAQCDVR